MEKEDKQFKIKFRKGKNYKFVCEKGGRYPKKFSKRQKTRQYIRNHYPHEDCIIVHPNGKEEQCKLGPSW